jgi:hypothetical protein
VRSTRPFLRRAVVRRLRVWRLRVWRLRVEDASPNASTRSGIDMGPWASRRHVVRAAGYFDGTGIGHHLATIVGRGAVCLLLNVGIDRWPSRRDLRTGTAVDGGSGSGGAAPETAGVAPETAGVAPAPTGAGDPRALSPWT